MLAQVSLVGRINGNHSEFTHLNIRSSIFFSPLLPSQEPLLSALVAAWGAMPVTKPRMVSKKQGKLLCCQMCIFLSMIICLHTFLATIGTGSCTGDKYKGQYNGNYYYGFSCAYLQGEQLDSIKWNTSSHALCYDSQLYSSYKALSVTVAVMSMLHVTKKLRKTSSSRLEITHAAILTHVAMLVSRWLQGYPDNWMMYPCYTIVKCC